MGSDLAKKTSTSNSLIIIEINYKYKHIFLMSHDDLISLHCIILFPQQMLQNMPPQGNSLTDICQNLVRSRYNVAYDKESKGKNNFLIS